jgi:hypothetical protein
VTTAGTYSTTAALLLYRTALGYAGGVVVAGLLGPIGTLAAALHYCRRRSSAAEGTVIP